MNAPARRIGRPPGRPVGTTYEAVVRLHREGKNTVQIGRLLGITHQAVDYHLSRTRPPDYWRPRG